MRVHFTSHEGGYSDWMDIEAHTTISNLISSKCPGSAPNDLMIRVNSKPVEPSYVLNDGDRVTVTPTKIDGGR